MHFCGSVITHYDTFILRLQSIVGSCRTGAPFVAARHFPRCRGNPPLGGMRHLRMPLPILWFAVSIQTAKNDVGKQLICRHPLRIIFCPHPSQTLRIFRWGRGCNASPFRSESCQIGDFHFRNDSDDCNGDLGGIILTVATVATVALRFNLFYRSAAHVCRSVWLCSRI